MFHIRSLSMKLWQMETISWCCHVHYFTSLVIWKGILCQHIFFPEALVILSKRRALGERKVCDKFPFPILDLSIKIEFLCSKCWCPCFMLESRCWPPPPPPPQKKKKKEKEKKWHNHCLRFLLGRLVTPRRHWKQWCCKFWGGGWGEKQGAFWSMWNWRIVRKNKYYNCKHDKEIS